MPTSPVYYLIFFFFFLVYWAMPSGSRRGLLAIASIAYCMWLDVGTGLTLILVTVLAFLGGRLLRLGSKGSRWVRPLFVVLLLLPLVFWRRQKELQWLVERVSGLQWDLGSAVTGVFGPIGVSFFTFRAVSYLLEVGRGNMAARGFIDVASYVTFFPQLLAGPIQRPQEFLESMDAGPRFNEADASQGVGLILSGLLKKVVAADALAGFVASKYSNVSGATGGELLIASYMFTFQLYLDFSGYSEIAVGLGHLLGLGKVENFRKPYFSRSPGEFWIRWHVSLMEWLRNYIYIPLGGNRCSAFRRSLNVLIVFAVSGLWHGNGMNFLLWGLLNGLLVILFARMMRSKSERHGVPGGKRFLPGIKDFLRIVAVFHMILLTWVLFRADGIVSALAIYGKIFQPSTLPQMLRSVPVASLVPTVLIISAEWFLRRRASLLHIGKPFSPLRWTCYTAAGIAILYFGNFEHVPFIYFKF